MKVTAAILLVVSSSILSSCSSSNNSTPQKTCASSPACRLFLTDTKYKGNLGGLSGADLICANDANNPKDGSTFKALLLTSSRNPKTASNNWILFKSKEYQRLDGTVVGTTTDESIFTTLTAGWAPTSGRSVWTGADQNWDIADNCNDWTSDSAPAKGHTGRSPDTDVKAWSYTSADCSTTYTPSVLCVEQQMNGRELKGSPH